MWAGDSGKVRTDEFGRDVRSRGDGRDGERVREMSDIMTKRKPETENLGESEKVRETGSVETRERCTGPASNSTLSSPSRL